MPEIYHGFSLRNGDDDGALRFGGVVHSSAEVGGGHHVVALRNDLVRLGFFLARETNPTKAGTFDGWLEEAVREFQVTARLPQVAREHTDPDGQTNYLLRLHSVAVPLAERYPLPDSGQSDCFASGVVNATTRRLIELWKARNWRCPWVIAEWAVPGKKPKKTLKKGSKTTPAADAQYKVGIRTLVRTDLTIAGRTPKVDGEVFLHDFSDHYFSDAKHEEPDPRFYLGRERSYLARRGPSAWPSQDPAVLAKQIPITPVTLTGEEITDMNSPAASTFRVVAAVARIEVTTGLQMVNAYDLACQSAGLFHFALVTPAARPNVGKGELGGVFSLLEKRSQEQFNRFVGNFGLRHEVPWGTDGRNLMNRVSGIWESYSCRESANAARGERIDKRPEANLLQSWQWLARLNMLAFVSPAYHRVNWDLARMRLHGIQTLPVGGSYPAAWTLGQVFSSERLMAKLLRVHVRGSMTLATLPTADGTPTSRKWVHKVLKGALTEQEVAAGPTKWNQAVLNRLEKHLDAHFTAYKDRIDKNGKTQPGDFTRIAEWRWNERGLSAAPRSFQLATDEV